MREAKSSDQEVFESIPWEELRDLGDTSRRRRIWFLVGGAGLLAVIVFSVVRTFSAPDPLIIPDAALPVAQGMAESPVREEPMPTVPPTTTPTTVPPLPSEAGLMAEADVMAASDDAALSALDNSAGFPRVDPGAEEGVMSHLRAGVYAEWFVLEYFTRDGSDHPPGNWAWWGDTRPSQSTGALSYVEWVRTLRTEPVGDGRWRAEVGLRRLVSTDGVGYSRLPTQAVEVVIDLARVTPAVIDLPRLIPLPEVGAGQWWLGETWETPPPQVIQTAREQMALSGGGALGGEPRFSRAGDAWRVEWTVLDPAGISWPVSLWIGPEGALVPAGG